MRARGAAKPFIANSATSAFSIWSPRLARANSFELMSRLEIRARVFWVTFSELDWICLPR